MQWSTFDRTSMSADELAESLGISKSYMYELRANGWVVDKPTGVPQSGDLAEVVKFLTEELVAAKVRIAQLEGELEELRA